MGKGGRRRTLPTSPLHPGGPTLVGLVGRGFTFSLVKLPITVNATTPEELVEKTDNALVNAVEGDESN